MKRILTIMMLFLLSIGAKNATSAEPVIKVTLLGTGIPLANSVALNASGRALSGLLVEAGSERFLFDCGQGIYSRLLQSGGSIMKPNIGLDKVFISHLHSDHTADLSALYGLGAIYRKIDATDPNELTATLPLRVWGPGTVSPNQPVGTDLMMDDFHHAYETDFYIRQVFDPSTGEVVFNNDAVATDTNTITVLSEGGVYSFPNGATVTAFLVDHHPVAPSYGFRVDYLGHSVVYSGDTSPTPPNNNLINYSMNVDLLIHEVYGFPRAIAPDFYDYHTSPEDVAKIFQQTTPHLAVFTHLAMPPGTTPRTLIRRTRKAGYRGPLIAGRDLMEITVKDNSRITAKPLDESQEGDDTPPNGVMADLDTETRQELLRQLQH